MELHEAEEYGKLRNTVTKRLDQHLAGRLMDSGAGGATMQETAQQQPKKKTLIGVLASHDSSAKHWELADALQTLLKDERRQHVREFHFVFTGGTFDRLVLGTSVCADHVDGEIPIGKVRDYAELRKFLKENSTRLPDRSSGGLVLLSNLVIHHKCELLWLFLSPDRLRWMMW